MQQVRRGLWAAVALLVLLSGCGDGAGIAPPGGSVSTEERMAAIAAGEKKAEELSQQGLARAAFNQEMAKWLASRPEFEASGVDEDTSSVWARFRDGRLYIVANNRDPSTVTQQARQSAQLQRPGGAQAKSTAEIPVDRRVRLLHSFGPGFDQVQKPIEDLAQWFKDAGYTVAPTTAGDARVSQLKAVSGDGFFYFNTHGGKGKTRAGHDVFAMQSSTLKSDEMDNLPEFKDDLDHGRLVYMTAKNGGKILGGLVDDWDTRYAITYLFVEKYMSFGKNSVLFFNVCFGANPHADISSFVFAAHKKGAAFYLSWTKSVTADPAFTAVRYFVDRMLGRNNFRPENPKQRPFDLNAVLTDMKARGFTVDASTGAELLAKPAVHGTNSLLAPTIYALEADEDDKVRIHGDFGTDPGADMREVTVGGTAVTVNSWAPDQIEVAVPRTGAGSSGDVVVTVRGRKSNPRQLIAWRGRLTYTMKTQGTLKHEIAFDLHLRGDADLARTKPGEAPRELPEEFVLAGIKDARGTYSASGTATWTEGGCTYTEEWSGSGAIVYGQNDGKVFLGYSARIEVAQRKMRARGGALGTQTIRTTRQCPGGAPETITYEVRIVPIPELHDAEGFLLRFDLDAQFNVLAGSREVQTQFTGRDGRTGTARLEWQQIAADPPYDPEPPKRIKGNR